MTAVRVHVEGLSRAFGSTRALHDVSLTVEPGELLALLGPSGSGKTTLLRVLGGLDFADSGRVRFDELDVSGLHARERQIGFVFQHYALFEHMSVLENIGFGLDVQRRRRGLSRAQVLERASALLGRVGLEGLGQRRPSQLSGGQRQRVALARALAIEPRVLLLDEPFAALDTQIRRELGGWVRALQRDLGITAVLVTHNPEEAMRLADRIAVLEQGRLLQIGAADELVQRPAASTVSALLGGRGQERGEAGVGVLRAEAVCGGW